MILTKQQIGQLQGFIANCLELLYQKDNSLVTWGGMYQSVESEYKYRIRVFLEFKKAGCESQYFKDY